MGYRRGYANIDEKSTNAGEWYLERTTAVGVYGHAASAEGVLDLSGNVWEWCLNKYDDPDQVAPDTSGDSRVVRGGAWTNGPVNARGSQRFRGRPDYRLYGGGFRLVSSAPIA